MNKSYTKLVARLQPKAPPLTQSQPKPSLKRKHEGDDFKRAVKTKLESSSTRANDNLKIKIELKKEAPMHSSQQFSRKENPIKPANKSQSLSKSVNARSNSVQTAIQKSLNKLGGKPPRTAIVDKTKTSALQTVHEQKAQSKAALKSKFDELMRAVQEFGEKKCLFINLKDLTNQMNNECNPAFEICHEKIQQMEREFEDRKIKQFQELESLRSKITMLKETQKALALSLSTKKQMNEDIENQEQELNDKVKSYDAFILRNQELLAKLLNRKEDLSSFEINVEEAIRNTKEKVRTRYNDISIEEKKSLILEELLHTKKQSVRTFLLLKGEKPCPDHSGEYIYRITTYENTRRIKLELNGSLPDNKPRFYEFDSIYHVNQYQIKEQNIFAEQGVKLYSNMLTTIFETEQKIGYIFLVLSYDESSVEFFKQILSTVLQNQLDRSWSGEPIATQVRFDNQGKITLESACPLQYLDSKVDTEDFSDKNFLVTFETKLKNSVSVNRLTFILASGLEKDLTDTFKKATTSTKSKKVNAINAENIVDNQNILSYIQNSAKGSAIYTFLTLETQQNKTITCGASGQNDLECLTLLNTLSRLKC